MTSWHSYPKVWNLGHAYLAELLLDEVLVEEKIDGSQFSFGRFGDVLKVRSKGQEFPSDHPPRLFESGVQSVIDRRDLLHEGWTYRCEFLSKPKHNALAYDRVPLGNLIVFDINIGEEEYLSYECKKAEAERIGLEVVPILARGMLTDLSTFKRLLESTSTLGGQRVEGVVIKNYRRFGVDKKALMGKHVSEAFREIHAGEWRKENPTTGDILERILERFRTPARWAKAVQHLRDGGVLEGSPRDIGKLMAEAKKDFTEECKSEVLAELEAYFFPKLVRAIAHGLPEWYKEQLLQKQFEGLELGTVTLGEEAIRAVRELNEKLGLFESQQVAYVEEAKKEDM
jgi:RNA ligase